MRQSSRRGNLNSILVNLFEFSLSELLILTWACRHSLSFIVTLSFPCIPFGWAMWTADSSASSSIWMSDSPLRSRSSTAGQSVARLSPGTKAARNNWKISREVFFLWNFESGEDFQFSWFEKTYHTASCSFLNLRSKLIVRIFFEQRDLGDELSDSGDHVLKSGYLSSIQSYLGYFVFERLNQTF